MNKLKKAATAFAGNNCYVFPVFRKCGITTLYIDIHPHIARKTDTKIQKGEMFYKKKLVINSFTNKSFLFIRPLKKYVSMKKSGVRET